ncbi:uncharacterized protein [Arachis hypogaea]|uniref:uncharacterized protein n=1 Tax=Arachis hypogaea TaxID=3818 RepID=UPI000DEDA5F9
MAQSKHIDKVLDRHSDETITNNRLKLKTSINAIQWLAFQACAFRGSDESPGSLNRENFIELIKLLASSNQNVNNVVLENTPENAQYISPGKFHQFFLIIILMSKILGDKGTMELLRVAQANNVAKLIANDQIVTGSRLNQIRTLQRAGDTRCGSHLNSVRSLLCMFDATYEVLEKKHRRSHDLCQVLQRKNQDILNALTLVSTTKTLIQRMRESSWEAFIKEVILFCEKHEVEVPDMNALHIPRRGRTRKIVDQISVEHHYHVNLFLAVIDTQLQELNGGFNDITYFKFNFRSQR